MTQAIAYLVSEYPHIRHAYLLREIRGLRKLGWEVETLAMRHEVRASGIYTAEEREERDRCFYVLSARPAKILTAHLATLVRHPGGYVRGLAQAIRYGGLRPRTTLAGSSISPKRSSPGGGSRAAESDTYTPTMPQTWHGS